MKLPGIMDRGEVDGITSEVLAVDPEEDDLDVRARGRAACGCAVCVGS
jgi:hypothetical protein